MLIEQLLKCICINNILYIYPAFFLMKHIFLFFIAAAIVSSCSSPQQESQWMNIPLERKTRSVNIATYAGILPCADCPGLKTILKLNFTDSTFELAETYLEAENGKDVTSNSSGKFDIFFRNTTGSLVKVIRINQLIPDETQCFIALSDTVIKPAMKNGEPLERDMPGELKLQ